MIVFVRTFSGSVKKGDKLTFKFAGKNFQALEVGIFSPDEKEVASLGNGEIGYIVTGIKEPGIASVGDTVASQDDALGPCLAMKKLGRLFGLRFIPKIKIILPLFDKLSCVYGSLTPLFHLKKKIQEYLVEGFGAGF